MAKYIALSKACRIINSGDEFQIKYIAHGDPKRKRSGGYTVEIKRGMCTSSFYENHSINIRNLDTHEIRECKAILIIELNGVEVIY